jgi:hypothetical protein
MKKIDFPALIQKHKTYLLGAPNTSEAVAKEKAVTVVAESSIPCWSEIIFTLQNRVQIEKEVRRRRHGCSPS